MMATEFKFKPFPQKWHLNIPKLIMDLGNYGGFYFKMVISLLEIWWTNAFKESTIEYVFKKTPLIGQPNKIKYLVKGFFFFVFS